MNMKSGVGHSVNPFSAYMIGIPVIDIQCLAYMTGKPAY